MHFVRVRPCEVYNEVAIGLLEHIVSMITYTRLPLHDEDIETKLLIQKMERVKEIERWVLGSAKIGKIGLFFEIGNLIKAHKNDNEALPKIKCALSRCGVKQDTAPAKIGAIFTEFVMVTLKFADNIQNRNEYTVLEICHVLAEILIKLKNAITPDIQDDVTKKLLVQIEGLQKIALMRTKQINHGLSDLKTPEISEMASKLLLDGSEVDEYEKFFVDDEEEWANICGVTGSV